jgi:TolB-like protein/Flp pilus assembly protein TadD
MGEPTPGIRPPESAPQARLDSWKEIAVYLNRDVTTVQRWERREGMPVHRHLHDKRGSVYALSSELDAWLKSRKIGVEDEPEELPEAVPQKVEDDHRSKIASGVSRRLVIGLAVAVLAVLAGAYVRARIRAGNATEPIKSLAVLPLKNLSGDPSQEYLADGLTEALIGRIANIQGLRVISRTSVMRFKDSKLSLPELAKAVGADAVLEGSVIREGDRIRVSAQLIRASTDTHLFSTTYDRELQQVLALESDVAQDIARKVEVTLSGRERSRLAAQRTVSPEVYESYLKGRFALNRSQIKTSLEESIRYFEDAIGKDPSFSPAYLGLAQAYQALGTVYAGEPPEGTRKKMFEAVQRALQLDPESAAGHVLLGYYYQASWNWTEAEAEYRRALDLNPNDAQAYDSLAYWSLCHARFEEALQYARHGRQLDPFTVSGIDIGDILFHAHRYNESIQELKAAISVEPDNALTLWWLGFPLIANHQSAEAVSTLEKSALLSHRSPGVLGVLVHAYVDVGRREDALRVLSELKERKSRGFIPAGAFVNAYLGLGDKEEAMKWLEQAYRERSTIVLLLKVHPFFDPLRSDPRFAELQRHVGLG